MRIVCLIFIVFFGPLQVMAEELGSLRDPTRPDYRDSKKAVTTMVKKPAKKPKAKAKTVYRLQQTLVSPQRRLAVINGRQLQEGEFIHSAQVLSIANDRVVLREHGRKIILNMASKKIHKERYR